MLLNNDFADKEFYLYMLDTRGLEMENEGFDIVACIVLLAVLLFLRYNKGGDEDGLCAEKEKSVDRL